MAGEIEHPWYRELYDQLLDVRAGSLFTQVLIPWLARYKPAGTVFEPFKSYWHRRRGDPESQDLVWDLYAFSRVNDYLLFVLENLRQNQEPRETLTLSEYEEFFVQNGFTVLQPTPFTPFFHEIARAYSWPDDDDQPISLVGERWPTLMLGDLVFSRGGVEVTGGRKHLVPEIAEKSTLYWSHRRAGRKTNDLSVGWGHNSQWRTAARRDYRFQGTLVYNADGENLLNDRNIEPDHCGLTHDERIELCRHRSMVVTTKDSNDLFPFFDRWEEPELFPPT